MRVATVLHCIMCKRHNVIFSHVHSHEGHPWNEMADCLCSYYKSHPPVLWHVPFGPFSHAKYFALCLAVAINDESIASSLSDPLTGYDFSYQVAMPPEDIHQRALKLPAHDDARSQYVELARGHRSEEGIRSMPTEGVVWPGRL